MDKKFPALLLLIGVLVYSTLLDNGFMIDDAAFSEGKFFDEVFASPGDYLSQTPSRHFYPLYYFLNLTKHRLFPDTPGAHYAINIAFFLAVCLLLYHFVRKLTGDFYTAAGASLLFCLHPINADNLSHTDISNTLLSGGMMLSAFISLLGYCQDPSRKSLYGCGLLFYLIAVLCGEPALLFPAYAVILLRVAGKETLGRCLKLTAPFWVIAIVAVFFWWRFFGPTDMAARGWTGLNMGVAQFIETNFYMAAWYTKNVLFPGPVFLIHNFSPQQGFWVISGIILGGLLLLGAGVLLYRWKNNTKSFALLWYLTGFTFMVPASLAHPALGLVLEPYWLFFPTMGAVLFLAMLLRELSGKMDRRIFGALIAAILILFVVRVQEKNYIGNNEALYAYHWLKATPGNLIAGMILSSYYEQEDIEIDPKLIPDMSRVLELFYRTGTVDRAERLRLKLIEAQQKGGMRP